MATLTKSAIRKLEELDRLEGPGFMHEGAQLADEILERLRELKDSGLLYSGLQLHTWLSELTKSAFETLELGIGAEPPVRKAGLTMRDLFRAVEADYEAKGKDLTNLKIRWSKHLEPVFGNKVVSEVRHESIFLYLEHRREQGAAPATINRECSILKRMYKLAVIMGRLKFGQQPYIGMQREDNARAGFLKDEQYDALARETSRIGLWFRALFELGYTYGWRRSELLSLKVNQLDLTERSISLEGRQTKNRKPRSVFMTDKVFELLSLCVQGKAPSDYVLTRRRFQRGFLFQHKSSSRFWWIAYMDAEGRQKRESTKTENKSEAQEILRSRIQAADASAPERQVIEFKDDWAEVCKLAGCEGLVFHDLRRTAVRNMIRSGISEKVAMAISGHLTAAVFKRYQIVDEEDLKLASRKIQAGAELRQQKKDAA